MIKYLLAGLGFILFSCTDNQHFITDTSIRDEVERDFLSKKEALPHGNLFEVFDASITGKEKEALTFLYAYMPIGDITDYTTRFYLQNIRSSFRAKEEMSWGNAIPEEIFRHFVLPVRVNNENMDESRMVFYEELKDRVKNLSLYDAVLEVNHWCHEKVIYTPSDSRTSSPLASVRTAYGRCGEESVFTVAALRSVGIPARQVYTPRWAHTDDNHAWVEAWVDGKWHFLGACEPEPVLNLAWFNEPVARGMLMHTKVFGKYNGPEEIMERTNCYTEVNVTSNYAPTASVQVNITDEKGNPVSSATVEFKVYNYAEFYTVATKTTDEAGNVSLSAGKGDMLVWVTKDGKYSFRKVSFGKEDAVNLILSNKSGDSIINLDTEIVPPVEGVIKVDVTEEQRAANSVRLHQEDSIRNLYVSTFYDDEKALKLAKELDADPKEIAKHMIASRGNWKEIESFLRTIPKTDQEKALVLLHSVSAKDVRDTPADILLDHLQTANPRVSNELLTPYRSYFNEAVTEEQMKMFRENPENLVKWVKENITINNSLNPQRIPIFPVGVWKSRVSDIHSRNIFFVSLARSLDIDARIESVTRKVQYAFNGNWIDVDFETPESVQAEKGKLLLSYQPSKTLEDPKYYSHFTIAKVLPGGKLQTLDFRSGSNDMGGGNTWKSLFKTPVTLDSGNYLLITGTRMARGNVLTKIASFSIEKGETTRMNLVMRENPDDIKVLGNLDAEAKFELADSREETSILNTTGRGYFIIGILGARQEPTNHAMRDISAVVNELNQWGRSMILLFNDRQNWEKYDKNEFGILPTTITYGIDNNQTISKMLFTNLNIKNTENLPLFVIADTFGRIVFVSQGYTIGVGEKMMNVIGKL